MNWNLYKYYVNTYYDLYMTMADDPANHDGINNGEVAWSLLEGVLDANL